MELSKEIESITGHVLAMKQVLESLEERLKTAKNAWPDHQIIPLCNWEDRNIIPPPGKMWASDGVNVWLINSDGKGIPGSASSVKFWTTAHIPAPPNHRP